MEQMWAAKLGLGIFHPALFSELETLMVQTPVDYTIFFRELWSVPEDIGPLKKGAHPFTAVEISVSAFRAWAFFRDGCLRRLNALIGLLRV